MGSAITPVLLPSLLVCPASIVYSAALKVVGIAICVDKG